MSLMPDPWFLGAGVLLDLALGDPAYAAHPVRMMGWTLTGFEKLLRRIGLDGYLGGILLFLLLGVLWVGGSWALFARLNGPAEAACHIFLIYSLLALRDLLRHGWDVERAAQRGDTTQARLAVAKLVGRDTSQLDAAGCRRAAIESVSEGLTDGFLSPILWYALGGLPGFVLFKVVSTMDSMVGYKTSRYLRFGWCGARVDDLMNWIPARMSWLLIGASALVIPRCSARKGWRIGWEQHAVVPGPNSGWSEATTAGAIQRRLVGPIWVGGRFVTDIWLGDPSDPPAGADGDFPRAALLVLTTGLVGASLAIAGLLLAY
jgi:adenosylcobinamide-phosphate synthase